MTLSIIVLFVTIQSLPLSSLKTIVNLVNLTVRSRSHTLKKNQKSMKFRQRKKQGTQRTIAMANSSHNRSCNQPILHVTDSMSLHLCSHHTRLRQRATEKKEGNSSNPP